MMERRLDFYILRITATFLQAILVVYQPSLKYLQANREGSVSRINCSIGRKF